MVYSKKIIVINISMYSESRHCESWNNDMTRKYNRIIDVAVMKVSIEKSRYNDKSHFYDGFSIDRGLSKWLFHCTTRMMISDTEIATLCVWSTQTDTFSP